MKDYIERSREERRSHLKLDENCIEIGGYDSREYRGLLAHYLGTEIPTHENIKIMLCHACNNHKCSNVNHLYWGTTKDNTIDSIEAGTWKSFYQKTVEKYGEKIAREMQRKNASKGGKTNKGRKLLSIETEINYINTIKKYLPIKRGNIKKICEELNISHTHVRRLIKKYNLGM
jgi:hypothetical protein